MRVFTRDPSWIQCLVVVAGISVALGIDHWWPIAAAAVIALGIEIINRTREL